MLGLHERAVLYRRIGQASGGPLFAEEGIPFPCRTQAAHRRDFGGTTGWGFSRVATEHTAEVCIVAPDMEAAVGDQVVLPDGSAVILAAVEKMRGIGGRVHHLEMTGVAGQP